MKHRNLTDLELVENASSIASMLSKYKTRGAVIDSTLMLLLVVGDYDIGSVGRDRTRKYTANDHRLVVRITESLDKIIGTLNTITEVDNYRDNTPPKPPAWQT
jgi:hypothetical protein